MGLGSSPSYAQDRRYFDVPAGPAEPAVRAFVRQARLSLIYERGKLDGFKTRGVKGNYETFEALRLLLDGSGLEFFRTSDHFISVGPRTRVTAESDLPIVEITKRASSIVSFDPPAGVTVRTFSAEELSREGFTTVPDWVRSLTQNHSIGANEGTSYLREALSNVAYGSGLNLYGIGQRATLILVNGQRLAPSGSLGSYTDVSNIPLSAIDHIELISNSASTLYGADAVGGIVNFVLRSGYAKPMTTLSLGNPGALSERVVAQSFATSGERWRAILGIELYSRNSLATSDRAQATNNLTPWSGSDYRTLYGNPGSILDSNGRLWGIPSGQNGSHLTGADLVSSPNYHDRYIGTWLLPQQRRINGLVNATYEWTDDTEVTLNALVNERWTKIDDMAAVAALSIPSSNPYYVNPVVGNTRPVQVLYGFGADLGDVVERGTVRSGQLTLALKHHLNEYWDMEASGGYAYDIQLDRQSNLVNFDVLQTYLDDSNPYIAFNPFGAGSNTNPQTLAAILTQGEVEYRSAFKMASVKAIGSLPFLPAGALKLTSGFDFSQQSFISTVSPNFNSVNQVLATDRRRDLKALYLQSSLPVAAGEFSPAVAYELKLAAGLRYEHFTDVGSAFLPSVGASIDIDRGISVSGSWAKMFRPPNLPDLNESINYAAVYPLPDPSSKTGYTNALIWGGNNAHLSPETANTRRLGIKWSPPSHANFSFETSYYNITSYHQILPGPSLPQEVLSVPQYNYLVTREPAKTQLTDICSHVVFQGIAGQCGSADIGAIVDLRLRSAETVKTDGFDFQGLYRRETGWGDFSAHVDANYVLHFMTQIPGSDFISSRNTAHNPTALRFRTVFRWEDRLISVSPAVNFTGSYTDTDSVPSRPVGAWTTWDLVVGYKAGPLDAIIGGRSTVSLRGFNVFNKQPPFLNNSYSFLGYDPENADLLGRRVSLRLEHEW
jgi:iron complex outermembrane receptor protein